MGVIKKDTRSLDYSDYSSYADCSLIRVFS